MKKRLLSIFIIFLAILIVVPTIGFSYWVFNNEIVNNDNGINLGGIDNIKENYDSSANSSDTSTEYTIYFFPSTFYTEQYKRYLNPVTDAQYPGEHPLNVHELIKYKRMTLDTILPELCFGYVERTFDNEGNVVNKNNILKNEYNANSSNTLNNGTEGDEAYKILMEEDFVSINEYDRELTWTGYDHYYEWVYTGGLNTDPYSYKQTIINDLFYKDNDWKRDGIIDKTNDDTDVLWFDQSNAFNKIPGYSNDSQNKTNRLGYWAESNYAGSNYLPIKITVTDTLSTNIYDLIPTPQNEMGDDYPETAESYYDYTFASWGYFDSEKNFSVTKVANNEDLKLGSFTCKDVGDLFDIMRNLDQYADENNVIRLFPIFSSGKAYDYYGGEDGWVADKKTVNGGKDSIDLNINGTKQNFLYNDEQIKLNVNGTDVPFIYGSIKNVILGGSKGSTIIEGAAAAIDNSNDRYEGNSHRLYEFNYNNFFEEYGKEDSLYNVYIFLSNKTLLHGYPTSEDIDFSAGFNDVKTVIENSKSFNSLRGKHIEILSDNFYQICSCEIISTGNADHKGENSSYFIVGIEKVIEAKFVAGLDSTGNINNQVDFYYHNSPSMVKQTHSVYKGKSTVIRNSENAITDIKNPEFLTTNEEKTSLDNEFIYIIKNIDLTNYSSIHYAAFQIRLYKEYDKNIHFYRSNLEDHSDNVNVDASDLDKNGVNTLIYDLNGDGKINDNEVYVNASYYFDLENDEHHSSGAGTGRYYIPKSPLYLGLYDFILYADDEDEELGLHYHLYAFRHSNVFVKLVSDVDPSSWEKTTDGYLNHESLKTVWENSYYIGTNISGQDLDKSNSPKTLEDAVREIATSRNDPGLYKVYDYVSGLVLAEYDTGTNKFNSELEFRIRKNYVLYVEKSS